MKNGPAKSAYMREYHKKNAEVLRAKSKAYYYKTREEKREKHNKQSREYRERNLERDKANKRAYYAANKEKVLAKQKTFALTNPTHVKVLRQRIARKCHTGFSPALVDQLRTHQKGLCAICSTVMDLAVRTRSVGEHADHCHASRTPRGLLCRVCNLALGGYERYQRPAGLVIEPYEKYLADPPVKRLTAPNT